MPRFYFDLQDHKTDRDDEGTELPDAEAARIQGVCFAADYLRDHPELVWDGREIRVVVRDQEGRTILTIVTLSVDGY